MPIYALRLNKTQLFFREPRGARLSKQEPLSALILGASESDNRVELGGLLGGGNAKEQSDTAGNADG
jgi:hypothetical protein